MANPHTNTLKYGNAFTIGIGLNLVFIVSEVIFGIVANSSALLADATHNFSDLLALMFSWTAIWLARRKPTIHFTYGLRRSTILIAFLNTTMLLGAIAFIAWETINKLGGQSEIHSVTVITVAAFGIAVNGFTAWLFHKGNKHDLNIRSTFVHFFADALVSLGVVFGGIVIALTGLVWIDSVVSFAIIAFIMYSSFHLLIDSVNLSLDAVPKNINIQSVREYLESLPEVSQLHDLHIWGLSTTESALSVHLTTRLQTDSSFISAIQHHLLERFHIEHATIQVEFGSNGPECEINCN